MEDFKAVKGRELFPPYFYRPQTKLQKVMFLHLSVSHSVHKWGVCIQGTWGLGRPPPLPLDTVRYGQRAGGTHHTGIHSCQH